MTQSQQSFMADTYHNKEEGSFGVLNFRDLGVSSADNAEHKKYIKEGMVFRSATLDNMSSEEVDSFIQTHNINTILDLRTSSEGREGLPIDNSFPTTAIQTLKTSDIVKDGKTQKDMQGPVLTQIFETTGQGTLVRKKYRVDFAGKTFQRYCVFATCSLSLKLYIVYLMAFCQRKKATILVGQKILTPMGVSKMYTEFVTYCKKELFEALNIFTDPGNYPIEIHCTQGKDRTGLVSAMIMSICHVPADVIVNDYAKTQGGLASIYKEMVEEVRKSGLSEEFAQAPPQNMRNLLDFLNKEYGSVDKYLDSIGFTEDLRERVRKAIAA